MRRPALRSPTKTRDRSRSPLKRSVKFETPLEKEIPAEPGGTKLGMMRTADARQAVPRKENETRAQWKNRIFNFKRSEEAKHGVGGKGDRRGKRS